MDLADGLARAAGLAAPPLVPADPWEAARARVWAAKVNATVTSEYYKCLVREVDDERRDAFGRLCDGLGSFADASRGRFFSGDTLGLVDCVLLPYAWRLYVLEHYRGFAVPRDRPWSARYLEWLDAATALPAVERTLPDRDRYLKHVEKRPPASFLFRPRPRTVGRVYRYASGAARSKVGNAVRRGKEAHEYDHQVDG